MIFNKIEKTFSVHTIVQAFDYCPLAAIRKPHEEQYPFWQLFYVSRGEMKILRGEKEERVSAGQVLFRPPGKKSVMLYPDDCTLYVGIIDFISYSEKMGFFPEQPIALDGKEKTVLAELIKEASAFCRESKSHPLHAELISSGLENFLIRLYGRLSGVFESAGEAEKSNTKNSMSEKVRRINDILEARRFSSVTIEEIATMLNESPNILMKCYKKEMHESIMEHFLNLKIQTAKTLIFSGTMNFTEISDFLGFSSVNYFSRFFKKRMGVTLTEYSRQSGGYDE